jgi:hypothetical protein
VTNILSSISGYFSKPLILGTFLPVVVFTVLTLLLFVPHLPTAIVISSPVEGWDKEWRVIGVSLVVIVVSGFMYNLNLPILRFYEGYPWRTSLIGSWLRRRERANFESAQLRLDAMRAALRAMERAQNHKNTDFISEVMSNWRGLVRHRRPDNITKTKWFQAWRRSLKRGQAEEITAQWQPIDQELRSEFSTYRFQLKHAYPDRRALIMPTRLGNVIRSFEGYSLREYGIDSELLWPRLAAVIPQDYAASIDDTKTTFDFMINCSLLSALLSFCILIAGLVYPEPLVAPAVAVWWLLKIVLLAVLSYSFYLLSINRAHSWGLLVKSVFDLYRWDLLKKLGYQQQPKQRKEERELWAEISRQATFGDRFDNRLLDYREPAYPSVRSSSAKARLEITRGVKAGNNGDSLVVYVRVRNIDKTPTNAIVVSDRLSDDLDLEWDTARVNNERIHVSGINPYQFYVGDLDAKGVATLTYGAMRKERKDH